MTWNRHQSRHWLPNEDTEILILDNRDSFVFNLAHRFFEVGCRASVVRSDEISVDEIAAIDPAALVVSPGPGHPDDAGVSVAAIERFAGAIPILGVCLGHQAIAVAFGGRVEASGRPMHGMASAMEHDGSGLFKGLENPLEAGRYHSLIISECPACLVRNAWCDGFVMALRHRRWPIFGVQFHPESVLTPQGRKLLANFWELAQH